MALVKIITGTKNSGKTTLAAELAELYRNQGFTVGGFLSVSDDKQKRKYYILDLITGIRMPAVCDEPPFEEEGWVKYDFSRFYFSVPAFEKANQLLENVFLTDEPDMPDVVIIDEFGPLELSGRGIFPAVQKLIDEFNGIVIIVIREKMVDSAAGKLGITGAEILRPYQAQ